MNTIVLRGDVEYPILFDIAIVEEIQKKYGSLEKAVTDMQNNNLHTTAWVVHRIVQEGVLLQNDLLGTHDKPPTEEMISRLITLPVLNDPEFVAAITDTFNEFMGGNATGQQLAQAGLDMIIAGMKKDST